MKKIVIFTQNGVSPQQKKWAKEAAEEFISVFPEYKDSFKIVFRDDDHLSGKEITQAEYDALPATSNKNEYIKNSDGKWLVPYKSMEWYLAKAKSSRSHNAVDAAVLSDTSNDYLRRTGSTDIIVNLVKNKFDVDNGILYGLTSGNSFSLSLASCDNEALLKTIFIHEIGHVFNATHDGRSNITKNPQKGTHCTNDSCIMGDDKYEDLAQKYKNRHSNNWHMFCNDCIASMSEYMSHMPELEPHVQTQQLPTPQQPVSRPIIMPTGLPTAPLPPVEQWQEHLPSDLPHNDREWKKDIREFYQSVAARDGDVYKENISSRNYVARIKRTDGSTLEIEANNEYNIALGATNPNGDNVPSLKDMRDLVKLTQQKNSGMNFGDNNTPEFNGRLLIACLEAQPKPLAMRNRPQITPEFLAELSPSTRTHLQNIINGQQQQRRAPQTNSR